MRTTTILSLVLALTAAASAHAADNRYVYVINNSLNTLTSLTATDATGNTTEFNKDVPLRGNETAYIQVASNATGREACLFTIDATFTRGEPLKVVDYNICKSRTLRLGDAIRQGRRQGG